MVERTAERTLTMQPLLIARIFKCRWHFHTGNSSVIWEFVWVKKSLKLRWNKWTKSHCVRSIDVKVLKSRWNFVKTKTTTPGNNIYTLLITFIAFSSFISCRFHLPYENSYCAWDKPVVERTAERTLTIQPSSATYTSHPERSKSLSMILWPTD